MRTVPGSHPRVTGRTEFERLAGDIEALASKFKPQKTLVGVNLIGEKRMSLMNRIYKGRKGSAEILTFDYRSEGDNGLASRRKVSRRAYALRLIAHGLCHLKGFSHRDDKAAGKMEQAEINHLKGIVSSRDLDRLYDLQKGKR